MTGERVETAGGCSEPGCAGHVQARGLCNPHYKARARAGTLPSRKAHNAVEAFWLRVRRTGTCWVWTGSITRYGYGQFMPSRGVNHRAHKFAWELENGPVPEGLVLDHLCRNRACVRPEHLEPVTPRVNALRGIGPTAINARKARCKRGHPFSPENTRIDSRGKRECRACAQAKQKRWNAALKAARAARRAAA